MADEEMEFVEDSTVEETTEKVEAEGKKYITATLGVNADSELIQEYDLLRNIGGFDNKSIVEAGVKALFASKEFKERAQKLKSIL